MTLNKSNLLVRFAYWGTSDREYCIVPGHFDALSCRYIHSTYSNMPTSTTLCKLFWRIVFRLCLVGTMAFAVLLILAAAVANPLKALTTVSALAAITGGAYLAYTPKGTKVIDTVVESQTLKLVGEGIWALKNRACPIIRLED